MTTNKKKDILINMFHLNSTEIEKFQPLITGNFKSINCVHCQGGKVIKMENLEDEEAILDLLDEQGDPIVCGGNWRWHLLVPMQ